MLLRSLIRVGRPGRLPLSRSFASKEDQGSSEKKEDEASAEKDKKEVEEDKEPAQPSFFQVC